MKKRLLSTLLALCMILSLLPVQALAAEIPGGETIPSDAAADVLVETPPEEEALGNNTAEEYPGDELPVQDESVLPEAVPEPEAQTAELNEGETSGSCGENLTWSFDGETGTLTISGSGAMTDFAEEADNPAPWKNLPYTAIVFDGGITRIGDEAFWRNEHLTSVEIPETVTIIGEVAFQGCTSLKSINIPQSVTGVGDGAFGACEALEEAVIGNQVNQISANMFDGCRKLKHVTLPQNLKIIRDHAFSECWELDVEIPEGVTYIGEYAFYRCGLTELTIPKGVKNIRTHAFDSCGRLKSLTIPEGVTSIGESAFDYCHSLTELTIPGSVKTISYHAFRKCSDLTSLTIREGVETIEQYAFYDCRGLSKLSIPGSVRSIGDGAFHFSDWQVRNLIKTAGPIGDGNTYDYEFGWTTSIPANAFSGCTSLTSVKLPEELQSIGDEAFYSCYELASIDIPEGVTAIGKNAFYSCEKLNNVVLPTGVAVLNEGTFDYCTGLTSITLPASLTEVSEYGAFKGCTGLAAAGPSDEPNNNYNIKFGWKTELPDYAFYKCASLTSVAIPKGITSIGAKAFYACTGLTSVTIPEGVASIGEEAFYNCSGLTGITISEGVISIGKNAFNRCTGLVSIAVPKSLSGIGSVFPDITSAGPVGSDCMLRFSWTEEIPEGAFSGCWNLSRVEIPATVKSIGANAFENCTHLTGITIPDSVESIGAHAFSGSGLESVTVPGSVKAIGGYAFSSCQDLTAATISDGVEAIGNGAFNNSGLTSLTIPGSVKTIGSYAFSSCQSLTSITIPDSVESIGNGAFSSSGLESVTIPGSVKSIGPSTFGYCSKLTDATISDGVESIGESAFSNTGLVSLTIPGSVKSIGDEAFWQCESLADVTIPDGVKSIGREAFTYSALTHVTIPGSVKSIGYRAFDTCQSLADVTILDGVESIGERAFMGCALEKVMIPGSVTSIGESAFTYYVTIACYKGSYAEYYANKNNMTCEFLTDSVFVQMTTNVPNGVTTGTEFQLHASYTTNGLEQADSLRIDLPAGITASCVWLDGKPVENVIGGDGSLTVSSLPEDQSAHTLYVYCVATAEGSYKVAGILTTDVKEHSLGPVAVEAAQGQMEVPKTVGHKTSIIASGKAAPGQAVKLFVDDSEAGSGTANGVGSWKILFDLPEASVSGSEHEVYAAIDVSGSPVKIAGETITYQASPVVQPEVVTMYNTGDRGAQETVFELTDPDKVNLVRYYRMWPARYPSFTFKAEFSNEGAFPSEVFIITVNSAKKERLVEATYDGNSGCWVGTSRYTDFRDAPAWVGVAYSDGDGSQFRSNLLSATAIMDPSGFVYEAVPSNRLEGVTAAISSEADGGKPWNAEDFDQINPQITGADGSYYWDVPAGNWKVSFTKEGYKPAETGTLTVPPPQVGINVAMVSTAAPGVEHAAVYEDGAEITFSQYMDIDSVKNAISLNGENVIAEAVDAEYDADGTTQYATRFKVTAAGLSGIVTLAVNGAKNYAGTAMAEPYSKSFQIEARPTALAAEEKFINMKTMEQTAVSAVLSPYVSEREILVENLTPQIIRTPESAATDQYGRLSVNVTALLPGTGILRLTDPISGLSDTVSVQVEPAPEPELSVTAELVNGVLTYRISKAPGENAQLIIASYQNERMADVKIIEKPSLTGTLNVADGSYTLFLVETGTMKPLCPAFSENF